MGVGSGVVPALKGSTSLVPLQGNDSLQHLHAGVDISTLMHQCLHHADCADEYRMLPLIPLRSFQREMRKRLNLLLAIPLRITAVFDGAPHPHKKGTNDGRAKIVGDSLAVLRGLQKREDLGPVETRLLNKMKKASVTVREDVLLATVEVCKELGVDVVCAAFEADFQVRLPMDVHSPSAFANPALLTPSPALSSIAVRQARATGHHRRDDQHRQRLVFPRERTAGHGRQLAKEGQRLRPPPGRRPRSPD